LKTIEGFDESRVRRSKITIRVIVLAPTNTFPIQIRHPLPITLHSFGSILAQERFFMTLALNKQKLDNLTDEIWKSAERLRGKFNYCEYQSVSLQTGYEILTTGIDVPEICNIVFLRRVNSRILYDQMIGRATRRCDEIEKDTFRIFDAVRIYEALQPLTAMKPVVVDPSITFTQLAHEMATVTSDPERSLVRDQFVAKLQRKAAMDDPLLPYHQRVDMALQKMLASRSWTTPQRQWLQAIAAQTKANVIVDRAAIDDPEQLFKAEGGGFARLDRIFGGELQQILDTFNESIWQNAA